MTDKPRGRIRSALLDVLAPPADDLAVVRPDSDPWSSPAGVAPGADLERVQDADLSARAHVVPFESYLDQQPRAAVPFAIDTAPAPVGQKAAGFVAQPPTPGATAWVAAQALAVDTPVQIVPANQTPRKVLIVVRGTGAAYLHPLKPNSPEYAQGLDVTATSTMEISTAGAIWIVSPVATVTVSVWVDYDQSAQLIANAVATGMPAAAPAGRPCSCGSH